MLLFWLWWWLIVQGCLSTCSLFWLDGCFELEWNQAHVHLWLRVMVLLKTIPIKGFKNEDNRRASTSSWEIETGAVLFVKSLCEHHKEAEATVRVISVSQRPILSSLAMACRQDLVLVNTPWNPMMNIFSHFQKRLDCHIPEPICVHIIGELLKSSVCRGGFIQSRKDAIKRMTAFHSQMGPLEWSSSLPIQYLRPWVWPKALCWYAQLGLYSFLPSSGIREISNLFTKDLEFKASQMGSYVCMFKVTLEIHFLE